MQLVLKNTLWLIFSFLVGKTLNTLWNLYLARYFNSATEEYGIYMYMVSQFAIFCIIGEGSVNYVIQQLVASAPEEERNQVAVTYWPVAIVVKGITGIFSAILFFILVTRQFPQYIFCTALYSLTLLIWSIGGAPWGIFAAMQKFRQNVIVGFLTTIVFIS